ncbi:MAG TPA: hypothetical protein DDZ62_04115, partial [Delftia acidovorans]|nr:hypothetical protein [Delftia acidovorans]
MVFPFWPVAGRRTAYMAAKRRISRTVGVPIYHRHLHAVFHGLACAAACAAGRAVVGGRQRCLQVPAYPRSGRLAALELQVGEVAVVLRQPDAH